METELFNDDEAIIDISTKDKLNDECSNSQCSSELMIAADCDSKDTNFCDETMNIAFIQQNETFNSDHNSHGDKSTSLTKKFKNMIQEINQRLLKLAEHDERDTHKMKIDFKLPDECGESISMDSVEPDNTDMNETQVFEIQDDIDGKINDEIETNKISMNDLNKISKLALCDEEEIRTCNELRTDVDVTVISETDRSIELEAVKDEQKNILSPTTAECDSESEKSWPEDDELSVTQDEEEIIANSGYTPRVLEIINEMKIVSPKKQRKIMKLHAHALSDLERDKVTTFMETECKTYGPGLWQRLNLRFRHFAEKAETSNEKLHKSSNFLCWRRRRISMSSTDEHPLNNIGVESTNSNPPEVKLELQKEELKEISLQM